VRVPPCVDGLIPEKHNLPTVFFDSKAGRTLRSSSVNNDQKELICWRRWEGAILEDSTNVVSGCTTCTNANRDSTSEDQEADRNGEVFFVCAIMSEHGLVANEVISAGNSEYAAV